MNVTLFRKRIFTDVIKDLKTFMGQGGQEPNSNDKCPY